MSTPSLVCVAGPRQGETHEISVSGLRLGRDPSNDIPLDDPAVSRFHGRVILHNAAIWVQDAGSRNGIFVNGVRVTANKQIKPGDKVAIGEHLFLVELVERDAEPSVSVNLSAVEAAALSSAPPTLPLQRRWRVWPFLLAGLLILGCVGLISARSGGDAPAPDETTGAADPDPGGYSLANALDAPPPSEAGAPAGEDAPLDLEGALAAASGGQKGWPKPPEGATVADLVDQGFEHQRAGRLREALTAYQQASQLPEGCEVCAGRIERIEGELSAEIQEHFDAGMRYYNSLQYQQAISAWEKVLLLEPDESAVVHQRTRDYLDKARKALGGG